MQQVPPTSSNRHGRFFSETLSPSVLGLKTGLFPILNHNVLPCAVISSEVMSSEESLKLIFLNPTEMTMDMPNNLSVHVFFAASMYYFITRNL
jgi:hypothetical protein